MNEYAFAEGTLVKALRGTPRSMQPELGNVGKVGQVLSCHTLGKDRYYQVKFPWGEDTIDEVNLIEVRYDH